MLNRKDYRKYWVSKPKEGDEVCKGCDIKTPIGCGGGTDPSFNCFKLDIDGNVEEYAVFKLIKKEVK